MPRSRRFSTGWSAHRSCFLGRVIERCEQTICELIGTPHIDGEEWLPVVAHSVLQGIAFIHKEGFIHKDIHPQRISCWIRDKMVPTKDPVTVLEIGDLRNYEPRDGNGCFQYHGQIG